VHWYNRDKDQTADERAEEIRAIKEAEAEALSVALYDLPVIYLALPRMFIGTVQWFWAIQEGIIAKHTRHRYKCNPNPSLGGDQCACGSRWGDKGSGEG
jgi:hypothetical protein